MDSLKQAGMGLTPGGTAGVKRQRPEETPSADGEPRDSAGISLKDDRKDKAPPHAGKSSEARKGRPKKASGAGNSIKSSESDKSASQKPFISTIDAQDSIDNEAPAALRNSARRASCTYLGDLGARLKAGTVKGEDFRKASMAIYGLLHNPQGDPLVRKMAQELMFSHVKGTTPVADWQLKKGPVAGPSECISSLWRRLENSFDRTYIGPDNGMKDFLDALQGATEGRRVPGDALKAAAHFSRTMQCRGDSDFKPDIREKEPRESDFAMADDAASLVEHWWHHGQITVTRDGREVLPGSLDLREVVRGEKVAVHDSEIRLSSPPRRKPVALKARVKELFDSIDAYELKDKSGKNDRDKGLAILRGLAEAGSDEARSVLGIFVESLGGGDGRGDYDLRKMGRILKEGQSSPALRELIAGHLPALSTLISRLDAREALVGNNLEEEAKVDFFKNLTGTFPELLKDERFFREELGTLLTCDEINALNETCSHMRELFEKDPSLVKPTMDIILADSSRPYLDERQCWLIHDAYEKHSWLPDRGQVEYLLPKLYQPPAREGRSIFHSGYSDSGEFPLVLSLFNRLRKEKPALIEGLELPDMRGRMVTLDEALKDRVFNDSASDDDLMRALCTRKGSSGSCRWAGDFYDFIVPDDRAAGRFLDAFEKDYKAAGALRKLTREGKISFTILSSLALKPDQEVRFKDIIRPERFEKQGFYIFSDYIDGIRREEIAQDMQRLQSGTLSASAQCDTAMDALKMTHRMGISSDVERRSDEILNAMEEGIGKASADTGKEADSLLSRLKTDIAANGTFDKAPEATLLTFQVLERLSRKSPALFDSLYGALKPFLDRDLGYGNGVLNKLLDPMRERLIKETIDGLWMPSVLPMERFRKASEGLPGIAGKSYTLGSTWDLPKVTEVFHEGMKSYTAFPDVQDMALKLGSPALVLDAYGHFAEKEKDDAGIGKAWLRFRDVMEHVDGESNYKVAMNFYDFIEEETAKGRDREQCLKHCMRAYTMEMDPRNVAWSDDSAQEAKGIVESGDDSVSIGGIRLKVRSSESE
ncbi:MAG: hypothetical protein RDV48_27705 [Candidatus Eremiobacteraeota bacterium]|nr:hypothetical protein [Candidatus Eremiobacteraeota bacterium]